MPPICCLPLCSHGACSMFSSTAVLEIVRYWSLGGSSAGNPASKQPPWRSQPRPSFALTWLAPGSLEHRESSVRLIDEQIFGTRNLPPTSLHFIRLHCGSNMCHDPGKTENILLMPSLNRQVLNGGWLFGLDIGTYGDESILTMVESQATINNSMSC